MHIGSDYFYTVLDKNPRQLTENFILTIDY